MQAPIGLTFAVPEDQEPLAVYDNAQGVEVFTAEGPYADSSGRGLQSPVPSILVEESVYIDAMGNARSALGVYGLLPPEPVVPDGAVSSGGVVVSSEGAIVVHKE